MSEDLKKYKEKRSFKKTPEPKGKKSLNKTPFPVFCVQRHDATTLHYDFRLEYKGVMLSWAVPKGPSFNPKDKRLAIQVEDHPLDYRHFEGVIPKGNYGAGSVMVWDEGVYGVQGCETKEEIEKAFTKGLKKGHLEFYLLGNKLKGSFNLLQMKGDKTNQWLLIKGEDEFANSATDIHSLDYSVKTKRTQEEIGGVAFTHQKKRKKEPLPDFFKPMLCTLVEKPFDDPNWIFETKWDGYRALAFIDENIRLYSRNKTLFNETFSSIVQELKKIKNHCVVDGEIVVLNEKGKSDFQLMQNYQTTQEGELFYYVFDLLYLDGQDLKKLPLLERKEKLKSLLEAYPLYHIRYSDHIQSKGIKLFKKAQEYDLEGIIAKKDNSQYLSKRSHDWLKIKTHKRQEAIIIGFTAPRQSRKYFGSLLLAVINEKKELEFIGHVGTGFKEASLKDLYAKMAPLIREKPPLKSVIKANEKATWIEPKLVCEISFSEWTKDGIMRQPVFQGLRVDKKPSEVKREKEI